MQEPSRAAMAAFTHDGTPPPRQAFVVLTQGIKSTPNEVLVDVTGSEGIVRSWKQVSNISVQFPIRQLAGVASLVHPFLLCAVVVQAQSCITNRLQTVNSRVQHADCQVVLMVWLQVEGVTVSLVPDDFTVNQQYIKDDPEVLK